MANKIKVEEMEVGKKYKGYAILTPYKEFCFTPEQTGSQAGREVLLFTKDNVTLKKTKNYFIVSMKMPLSLTEPEKANMLMKKFNIVFNFLKEHEL